MFPKIVVPQNGWFIMENPDDLGVPLFSETPIYRCNALQCNWRFPSTLQVNGKCRQSDDKKKNLAFQRWEHGGFWGWNACFPAWIWRVHRFRKNEILRKFSLLIQLLCQRICLRSSVSNIVFAPCQPRVVWFARCLKPRSVTCGHFCRNYCPNVGKTQIGMGWCWVNDMMSGDTRLAV